MFEFTILALISLIAVYCFTTVRSRQRSSALDGLRNRAYELHYHAATLHMEIAEMTARNPTAVNLVLLNKVSRLVALAGRVVENEEDQDMRYSDLLQLEVETSAVFMEVSSTTFNITK